MSKRQVKSLIMAAGMSTRMKSTQSKVLHEVCGKRILDFVLDACRGAGIPEQILIVGAMRDQVQAAYAGAKDISWIVQEPQLGTGHAVMAAEKTLGDFDGDLVVIVGDAAMIRTETVKTLMETHRRKGAAVTLVTAILDDPKWFGRIVRDPAGNLLRIVEAKDATPEQYAIKEVNPSFYAFRWPALRAVLGKITNNNVKKEYYLTDAIGLLIESGRKAIAIAAAQPEEVEAVNSREDLALVASLMRRRILKALMASGVTIEDPATTYVDWNVTVGQDVRSSAARRRSARTAAWGRWRTSGRAASWRTAPRPARLSRPRTPAWARRFAPGTCRTWATLTSGRGRTSVAARSRPTMTA
jgi:bifunctional UDP-N-acetylglucosamine pyrophosphorylase/glucosamine-1-phosphate N-acetyltransferase